MSEACRIKSKPKVSRAGKRRFWAWILCSALVVTTLSVVGCSNNDSVSSGSGGQNTDLGALNYIPMDVGYSASYLVTDANGLELRRESYSADSAVFVDGHVGVSWVQRNLVDSSVLSRGAMHWNSDKSILYHSEDSSLNVERLLRSPLNEDAQWPRWHDPSSPGGGEIVIGAGTNQTNNNDALGVDTTNGGANGAGIEDNKDNPFGINAGSDPQLSSFPTQGASTFYVASMSDDLIIDGKTYADCMQVINANSNNTVNRYWYCLGIGLVKYALYCKPGATVGTENGTILK